MTGSKFPFSSAASSQKFDHFIPFINPVINFPKPPQISTVMWRSIANQALSRTTVSYLGSRSLKRGYSFLGLSGDSVFKDNLKLRICVCPETGFRRIGELSSSGDCMGKPIAGFLKSVVVGNGFFPRGYASVAEAVFSTDCEEDVSVVDEVQELLQEMRKEERRESQNSYRIRRESENGMGMRKYHTLRRRQIKIETEAWKQAAKEYRELLMDMCERKLAPNLPYMKTLFLGWFEPLRDAIAKEQELIKLGKVKTAYAPYLDQLPADMMAVITMHKLMGLLMTGEHGSARVVQAACFIGEAIEQEARIHKFLEKTKKKRRGKHNEDEGDDYNVNDKENEMLRKKVTNLIKKQKLPAVRHIVKGQDDSKPWGQDVKAKVGSHLIELLIQTAYIQPPVDQLADSPPDIRPAFMHTLKTLVKENMKTGKRYGIIQCDPLVLKGLERTARHMVIPYIPMLVPPLKWTRLEVASIKDKKQVNLQDGLITCHVVRQYKEMRKLKQESRRY